MLWKLEILEDIIVNKVRVLFFYDTKSVALVLFIIFFI